MPSRQRISNTLRLAALIGVCAAMAGCGLTARDSFFFSRSTGLKPIDEASPQPIWLVDEN